LVGYSIGSGCEDCDDGYTKVNSICYKDCYAENIEGVNNKTAIPLNGALGCDVSGFSGSVDYNCKDGLFSLQSNQYCINNSRCYGGDEDYDLMVSGKRYRVHKFTKVGSANLNCYSDKTLEYLIVGGGGGGGNGGQAYDGNAGGGGGGGAGGFLSGTMSTTSKSTFSVVVGAGGSAGVKGGDSSLGTIIAYGGGFGNDPKYPAQATDNNILNGGSGGGASDFGIGGLGVSGQGNNGCVASTSTAYTRRGGGGGGAGPLKACSPRGGTGGPGIDGKDSSITGTQQYYAAGGGGAATGQNQDPKGICYNAGITYSFSSASGIGGVAAFGTGNISVNGTNGKENTGSGGGGGSMCSRVKGSGGKGGSGIVVVRYAY